MPGAAGERRHLNVSYEDPVAAAEPDGNASVLEILLPPAFLTLTILLGTNTDKDGFINTEDKQKIKDFCLQLNRMSDVLKIALPCLITLSLCPLTLLIYKPILHTLWPAAIWKTIPKVNDVIACFLTPAGLIYAISYGFAFQESMGKQTRISQLVNNQVNLVEQIAAMVMRMTSLSAEMKKEILKLLKCEVLKWMDALPKRCANCSHSNFVYRQGLWRILDIVQDAQDSHAPEELSKYVTNHILQLESISTDRMGQLSSSINLLQWIFLEILGFFAFFGIFLVRADSYRLELCMCIITIFSISLFCYVLADLDSPFHGAFRVDLSILTKILNKLEEVYKMNNVTEKQPIMEAQTLPSSEVYYITDLASMLQQSRDTLPKIDTGRD